MRRSFGLLFLLALLPTGCGSNAPMTAHGKPVSHWVERIRDPDLKTRLQAVKALGNVGVKDPAVVPTLIVAVKDKSEQVRIEAILALLRIGPGAAEAIPVLTQARQNSSAKVREHAAKALEKIQGS